MKTVYVIRNNLDLGIGFTVLGHAQTDTLCAAISAYTLMLSKLLICNNLSKNIFAYGSGCVMMLIPEKFRQVIDSVTAAVKTLAERNQDIMYREI